MLITRICTVILVLMFSECVESSKILGFFVTISRSHYIIQESLMRGLAVKGHEVTIVSYFDPPTTIVPNATYIKLEMGADLQAKTDKILGGLINQHESNILTMLSTMISYRVQINTETLTNPVIERLKREESFDLVVIGWFINDFQIGLAEHFKCPAVIVTPTPSLKAMRDLVGNPTGAAYIPFVWTEYKQMTFVQRVVNYYISLVEGLVCEFVNYFVYEPLYREHFPPNEYPSFADAKKNVALVLVTSHFSQSPPIATFPSFVEVSGMHIPKEAGVLPNDIQHWLDTAENGVIYFSFGTNVKSTQISAERRASILKVFSKLKQRVLWKWEDDDLPNQPENVMIRKWMPQADILAHPNVKLFISHCGKGSINEARLRGVPLLCIPFFGDQPSNTKVVADEGWAVPLLYTELTEQTFGDALQEALTNPKYGNVVRKEAQLYADRPMHPLDTAVYWVEYVIRHNGAKHMQSQAVHLNWFQYYSLDVVAFLGTIIWVAWKVTVIIGRTIFSYVKVYPYIRISVKVKAE